MPWRCRRYRSGEYAFCRSWFSSMPIPGYGNASASSSSSEFSYSLVSSRGPRGNSRHGGCFQYFQIDPAGLDLQSCPDAERQGDVAARNVPGTQPVSHGHIEVREHTHHDLFQRISLLFITIAILRAVQHFAKDNASNLGQFSRQLQLHEHAVNLVRLGGDVFEKQDGVGSANFIRRAQRSHKNGEASAVENSFRGTFAKRFHVCIQV